MITFLDTEYSYYKIASKYLKEYAEEQLLDITSEDLTLGIRILIKSNLIGLNLPVLRELIKSGASCWKIRDQNYVFILDEKEGLIDSKSSDIVYLNSYIKNLPVYDLKSESLIPIENIENLVDFELKIQKELRKKALSKGVFIQNPDSCYLSYDTEFGKEVFLEPHLYFGAKVWIGDKVRIKAFSYLEEVSIECGASIGPFSRIRGTTSIGESARIGNFVEIKNSKIAKSVKIGHLSYIGDSEIGENSNIGAGAITCNYDGVLKHRTYLGKNCFIGTNSSLIAPLTIGDDAFIAAGSVINKDIPTRGFGIARAAQRNKINKMKLKCVE
jgi:UDP-N-acetylglucosamine diphosphorylase/glucosamine-1-phosphate N-acetyltransferase